MTASIEKVVIVHGFCSSKFFLLPLQFYLKRQGFDAMRWGYESLFTKIEKVADRFSHLLRDLSWQGEKIHIVAHSMGCIVTRAALLKHPDLPVGRVVFLAPPNQGSPLATAMEYPMGWMLPPMKDLSSRPHSYVSRLDTRFAPELGIIAGRFDFTVPAAKTKLGAEKDRVLMYQSHNSMLVAKTVGDQAAYFLRHGKFRQ